MGAHRVNKLIAWDLHLLCVKKNEAIERSSIIDAIDASALADHELQSVPEVCCLCQTL